MKVKGRVLVKGHGLINEGTGYEPGWPPEAYLRRFWTMAHDRGGVAVCWCGAISDPLPSDAARKRWHRDHKANLMGGNPTPDPA